MNGKVIEASAISKAYTAGKVSTPVLNDVDLCVRAGECLLLTGPSGSGKTTLLSIIGCLLTPNSGQLDIFGRNVLTMSPAERAELRLRRIGFVFQRLHLFAGLRAWENIRVALDLLGRPASAAREESQRLLEIAGIGDRADQRTSEMSMGQRQRVAIARALAADPDLILADEPTASLDAEAGQKAMTVFRQLCTDFGKTVVIVTHDPRTYPFADRILSLSEGRIAANHTAAPRSSAHAPRPPVQLEELACTAGGLR
ncbi:MAG TPA: ABC transporter ATP-binding protein [Caulifigura sp.]|jgi:putative ABC transport system ATP-binding protein|nr:ABC transporter ATP-binding protein [Caulifigura sp.]